MFYVPHLAGNSKRFRRLWRDEPDGDKRCKSAPNLSLFFFFFFLKIPSFTSFLFACLVVRSFNGVDSSQVWEVYTENISTN